MDRPVLVHLAMQLEEIFEDVRAQAGARGDRGAVRLKGVEQRSGRRVPETVSQVLPVERAIQKQDPGRQGVREAVFRKGVEDALACGAEAAERDAECV